MLSQEQLKHLNDEVMGLKPLSPLPEYKEDEADSYAFTTEAAKPVEPLPQNYQSAQVGGGFADLTFPSLTEENNTPVDFQQAFKEKLPGVANFVGETADRMETSLSSGVVNEMQEDLGIKRLDAWKTYTNARPEMLREVRNISIETGIPEKVILYSPDSLNRARNIYNYRRKQMALSMPGGKNDPGMNEVTIDQLTEAYPGLDKIINADSVTEAAIALENIENVRHMKGILDAGIIGYQRGLKQREMQKVGRAAFESGRDITEEEMKRYRELEDEYKTMLEAPDFFDNPMVSLVGRTAEQAPQQAWGLLKGTLYGGVLAGTAAGATAAISPLTGGASLAAAPAAAKWGFGVGMRVGYAEDMWTHSAAQRYLEYSQYKDENGKRVLTNAEAQAYAAVAAALETGIEFANADTIVKVLKGNKSVAANQIRNIMSGVKDNASFIAGLKQVLSGMKEVAFSETLEEGAQEVSDRLLSNAANAVWGGNIPTYSPSEIAMGGVEAMAEAFLPSVGFAAMAGGSSSFKMVRRAAAMAEMNNNGFKEYWKNVNGIGMINRLLDDAGILKYFKDDPDVARKTLQGTVEGTDYETVNIDTEYAMKKEGGEQALREVAEAAGMSEDTVQAAIDTKATIAVPTAVYLQTRVNTENFALGDEVLSFSDEEPCLAREKEYYEAKKAELEAIMSSADARQVAQQTEAIDRIVKEKFDNEEDRELATSIIMLNPKEPKKGLKELQDEYQSKINAILSPIMETVRRATPDSISDAELRQTAMDILTGNLDGTLPDYLNTPEMQEFFGANAVQVRELQDSLNRLGTLAEKINSIDAGELQTMEGMTNDAVEVYRQLSKEFAAGAPNTAVERSAKAGAALMARHADRYAEAKRAAGEKNYTAQDYLREKFGIKMGGEYEGGAGDTFFQVSADEFNRQKEDVVKQYKDTDLWMKAPNGNPTNLTEDQWVTVRTPAFKNWFGHWDLAAERAKLDKAVPVPVQENRVGATETEKPIANAIRQFNEMYPGGEVVPTVIGDVKINEESVSDSLSHKFSQAKLDAVLSLVEGMKTASYMGQMKDPTNKAKTNHYFVYKIKYGDGTRYVFVRGVQNFNNPAKLYVHEVYDEESIKKRSETISWPPDHEDQVQSRGIALYTSILNAFLNNVNSSKVVDENGEPLVVYHGTKKKFDTFEKQKIGTGVSKKTKGGNHFGSGFYFTPTYFDAQKFGRNVLEVFLSIKNPASSEYGLKEDSDGIIASGFNGREYVAFEPTQIKDATGHNVGFDPQSGNIYLQRQAGNGSVRGATEFMEDGKRILKVFESGNESTIAHEMGHIFLADLKDMAAMENAPAQIVKDWETVKEWLGWQPDQAELTTAQHEKFAQGFEAYLMSGEAPVHGLKKIFRQFKRWLTKLYKDFLFLGGKPSMEVAQVMGRMLATEEEVEAAFLLRGSEFFDKTGATSQLDATSLAMYQRWKNEATQYAEEKVLARAMKDLTEKRKQELDSTRQKLTEDIQNRLLEEPVYKADALLEANPEMKNNWPAEQVGITYEEYQKQIKERGSLEEETTKMVNAAMQELEDKMPMAEIKEAAERAVNSSDYRSLYLAFERRFMLQKQMRTERLAEDVEKALDAIEQEIAAEEMDPAKVKAQLDALRSQTRWTVKEMNLINRMTRAAEQMAQKEAIAQAKETVAETAAEKLADEKAKAETKLAEVKTKAAEKLAGQKERAEAKLTEVKTKAAEKLAGQKERAETKLAEQKAKAAENIEAQRERVRQGRETLKSTIKNFRGLVKDTREQVHVYRGTAYTDRAIIRQYAEEKLAAMTIPDATNVNKWRSKGRVSGHQSANALKRALGASLQNSGTEKAQERVSELWKTANDLKTQQLVYEEMAAIAQKNADTVRKKNARLQARMKSIRKNKSMPAQERYMYNHGLFILGLEKNDAPVPQNKPDILRMFQYYADDMSAYFLDEDGNVWLPDYLIAAFAGDEVYKQNGYKSLKMEQYGEFTDALDTIYRVGMDANKNKVVKDPNGQEVNQDVIIDSVVAETEARVYARDNTDSTNAGTPTFGQRIINKALDAKVVVVKPETILEWMGPAAERYIYEPIYRASNKEKVMLGDVGNRVTKLWSVYDLAERSEMRSKKQFNFGTSLLTREEMICVALNWGTEINKKRVLEGFRVTESTVMELLANMTEKDWKTVEGMWNIVNSFWDQTVEVEEAVAGIAPKKQEAVAFKVKGNDGNVYELKGGYYPIKYDATKSITAANREQDDVARQNMTRASMNRNLGFTKQRSSGPVKHPLLLSFDVFNKHIYDVVHNICYRLPLRDVRRILLSDKVTETLESHFGLAQTKALQQWSVDCWAPEKAGVGPMGQLMRFFRHKQTAAALGYNIKTALLNVLNLSPMAHYLGTLRTRQAIANFYENREENWNFCLSKSPFLRERAETMDRDAGEVLRDEFQGGHGKLLDGVEYGTKLISKSAFKAMAITDLALANPLWLAEYQRVFQDMMASAGQNVSDETIQRIDEEAISAGDKAVRKVFGSGEMKDLAPIQKGSELDKLFTMYYSYFNVVFNALYSGYAKGRMQSKMNNTAYHIPDIIPVIGGTDVRIEVRPLFDAFLYWTVFTGVSEGLMRYGFDALTGNDKDDDGWLEAALKGWRDNLFGTLPFVRDAFVSAMDIFMGERYYGARPLPGYAVLDNLQRIATAIRSDKKTKIDVFRESARMGNQFIGLSNTITDAMATTAYWADTDFDTPFYQYLAAVLLDKRIDKKKKKK